MRMVVATVAWLLVSTVASAQVADPPVGPPGEAPVVTTVDPGTVEDANAGRVAIMSTALTPPAGSFSFEDWELLLVSASYAPTDHLVLTATSMIPVTSDFYWASSPRSSR